MHGRTVVGRIVLSVMDNRVRGKAEGSNFAAVLCFSVLRSMWLDFFSVKTSL